MPNTITLTGWKEFEDKCKNLPSVLFREVGGEVEAAAKTWQQLAKQDAPIDQGQLARSITYAKTGPMSAETTSPAEYSAYVEWGTKTRVKVPADLQSYASEFRSKGTPGAKAFIFAWMNRVGIPKNKQYIVFFSIITKGIHPHPYFFIQVPKVEKQLFGNIEKILKLAH